MNYNRIYASIVLRAQAEYKHRRQQQKQGQYYELHHIIPKSLGGINSLMNRALLTAKEHFICHWLLTRMYPEGTDEYRKMIYAFWRMRSTNGSNHKRYINAAAYERLRIEFARLIGNLTSVNQKGKRNSHYGTKWYTNYESGESKPFYENPGKPWLAGRNLFNGRSTSIRKLIYNAVYKRASNTNTANIKVKTVRRTHKRHETSYEERYKISIQHARELWDSFHSGNYTKLEDYANELNISKVALYRWFKNYIPKYNFQEKKHRKHFMSNKDFIGVYE